MLAVRPATRNEDRVSKLVAVIGQGYVGLPLAMGAVDAGFDVVGVDVDERRVTRLAAADSFIEGGAGE